uniref:Uncharacterized protein n=1 Tax=Marseillevirus LCMAC102 TaxID=2506603 RepID=A0A481YSQ0_9VIRU|nr:MAG: hypothetical protein LCMAC102_00430 [Marseillevirus LCMAC102]
MLVPECISSKLDKSPIKLCSSPDDVFMALIIIDEFENGKHTQWDDKWIGSQKELIKIKETISLCEKNESCIPCVKYNLNIPHMECDIFKGEEMLLCFIIEAILSFETRREVYLD